MAKIRRTLNFFQDARWICGPRIRLYCSLFLCAVLVAISSLVLTAHRGIDWNGKPLGTDFVSFWSASDLALHDYPANVYVVNEHAAKQLRLFPQIDQYGYTAFFYPPMFLLICLPLALLPYFYSLFMWLVITGYLCWQGVKGFFPDKVPLVIMFSFPAIFINALHGQNAFLSCALFAKGVQYFYKKPLYSGIFFGFLCFKPHLVICIPVVMVVVRQWRALWAFMVTVGLFVLTSWVVLGTDAWRGFIRNIPAATEALERNYIGYEKMVSVFAAVRLLHGSIIMSYGIHVLVNILVLSALVYIAFRRGASIETGMMLMVSALIVTPFLLDYDLMLLAPVLAWSVKQAQVHGFMQYERFVLASAFWLPLLVRPVAFWLHVPLGPFVLLALAYCVARCCLREPKISIQHG